MKGMHKIAVLGLVFLLVVGIITGITGCGGGGGGASATGTDSSSSSNSSTTTSDRLQVNFYAGQNILVGNVTVHNDNEYLYVTYYTTDGWEIGATHLAVATSLNGIPQTSGGNPKIGNFPYQAEHDPMVTQYTYKINLVDNDYTVGTQLFIAAHAEVHNGDQSETAWAEGYPFSGGSWAMYFNYTVQEYEEPQTDEILPGDFRTQTQGGWGTKPSGNNPGTYRDANFASAFPKGMLVGCGSCAKANTIYFSSSKAVQNFLPQGGKAGALKTSYTDPTKTEAGVLGGQVTALILNVEFDLYDEDFGASSINLQDLVVADESSPFYGYTVKEVLTEANYYISGMGSEFSASEINSAVTSINENFVDGTIVGDFLKLP